MVARRRSTVVAATTTVKRRTILTWLIDTGFLSDREKVFYVPVNSGEGKVVSSVVTRSPGRESTVAAATPSCRCWR